MKVSEIREKYMKMGYLESTINSIIEMDTTPTKKYASYVATQYMQGISLYEAYQEIYNFEQYLPYIRNKDIYSETYNSFRNLRKTVRMAKELHALKKMEKDLSKQVLILKETDDYILLHPKTHLAARKYGYETRWCVAYHNDSYYNTYKDNLVFLILKKEMPYACENYKKVAFHRKKGRRTYYIYTASDSTTYLDNLKNAYANLNVDVEEIESIFLKFTKRKYLGFIRQFLPWTFTYKIKHKKF